MAPYSNSISNQQYESYIGVEEVISEFAKINLPRDSDILSPSSGPGIFSAKVTFHRGWGGYFQKVSKIQILIQ